MESANQNRRYHQPWKAEQSWHSKDWDRPRSGACISSLTTKKQIWSSDLGLLDRERSSLHVKPVSQQESADSSSQGLQPKISKNWHYNSGSLLPHILQQLPSNNEDMKEEVVFPRLYSHVGNSHQENSSDGATSSRWIAAGTELIKLDPGPMSRSIFKSPSSFIQNPLLVREKACGPGSKRKQNLKCNYPPMEAVRGMEQEIVGPSIAYITPANSKTRGPYRAKMCSSIKHSRYDSVKGLGLTEHREAEYNSDKTSDHSSLSLSGTIDLTDQLHESKDDSTCSREGNKFLLIDDQGIPYTVFKTDLINLPKAIPEAEDKSSQAPKKLHYCLVCFRTFLYLSDLERHSITHSEHKPFECKVCGKSFKRSSHLQRHKHIHTGERPFQCPICQKGFRESGELQRHQRVHTGEKPYQCELCHLRFTERNTLRRHIKRKHSKETLYQQDAEDSSDWGETPEDEPTEDKME
ncbi:hypothetical protein FKM82_013490 [Ascaphus truei]